VERCGWSVRGIEINPVAAGGNGAGRISGDWENCFMDTRPNQQQDQGHSLQLIRFNLTVSLFKIIPVNVD
jgi:hypothetical protein